MRRRRRAGLVLSIIARAVRRTGVGPSFDEIARGAWIRSKSGVHAIVQHLVDEGQVERLTARARAIKPAQGAFVAVREHGQTVFRRIGE